MPRAILVLALALLAVTPAPAVVPTAAPAAQTWLVLSDIARDELAWLQRQLAATPPGASNIVMMQIPPGYDPVSTQ